MSLFGIGTGVFHIIQAVVVLVLLCINSSLLDGGGQFPVYVLVKQWNHSGIVYANPVQQTRKLMSFSVPVSILLFFTLSGVFQLVENLVYANKSNALHNIRLRYIEYSISASLMIFCIALEVSIFEIYLLLCLALLTALVNLLGLIADIMITEDPKSGTFWLPHGLAWLACLGVWGILLVNYIRISMDGAGTPPWFVHVIVFSMMALFCSFGGVQFYDFKYRTFHSKYSKISDASPVLPMPQQQPSGGGKAPVIFSIEKFMHPSTEDAWVHLEKVEHYYDTLSLVAKSLLAWLILWPLLGGQM